MKLSVDIPKSLFRRFISEIDEGDKVLEIRSTPLPPHLLSTPDRIVPVNLIATNPSSWGGTNIPCRVTFTRCEEVSLSQLLLPEYMRRHCIRARMLIDWAETRGNKPWYAWHIGRVLCHDDDQKKALRKANPKPLGQVWTKCKPVLNPQG